MKLGLPLSAVLIALAAACYDPVHADDVASLGDEAPGVPEGPFHRPGQRCTTCHGGSGPGSPDFSIAGTVYAKQYELTPEVGAVVKITDKNGISKELAPTNSVGNFYIDKEEWDPVFPVKVEVYRKDVAKPATMNSTIGRDGGCATCHRGRGDRNYQPEVYIDP